jgi:NAD(P)-dependent dehydrogenase (short-subunit alcohol dehydrogenase family)
MDLKGKVAFVTGGSGDIGGAIARALATAGADVAISYTYCISRRNLRGGIHLRVR